MTSVKKRAGKVPSEHEEREERKSLGKVVGWEKEDIGAHEEEEEDEGEEEKQWKNPYLVFLDNLDDSGDEEEVDCVNQNVWGELGLRKKKLSLVKKHETNLLYTIK